MLTSGTGLLLICQEYPAISSTPNPHVGDYKDGQGCHHLPPTPTDRGEGMQTKVTSSLDTTSTLSITALAPARLRLESRVFRLEHPSRGWTMIPQAKDNKSLTLISTHQTDDNPDTYSKEAHIYRGTSRGKPTTLALLSTFSPHTP